MADPVVTCCDVLPGSLWEQSIVVALAAEELVKQAGWKNPADALTAGLFANVGKLGFASTSGVPVETLVGGRPEGAMPMDKTKRMLLKIGHGEA
ncbi:MAG: HDOD domain-containing protein [bacterium]|nr:HDOD domain-containing protein [bacterium]